MTFTPKFSPLWWTRNLRYFIYFLRESTGVFIALYLLVYVGKLTHTWSDPGPISQSILWNVSTKLLPWLSPIALAAAIFHTITWFWVTVKISPIPLPRWLQIIGFLGLISAWLTISYFLLGNFYGVHPL